MVPCACVGCTSIKYNTQRRHKASNIKYITNKWKYVLTSALNLYSLALTVYSGTAWTSIEVSNPCLMNEGLQLLQQLVSLDKRKGVIRNCKFVRSQSNLCNAYLFKISHMGIHYSTDWLKKLILLFCFNACDNANLRFLPSGGYK